MYFGSLDLCLSWAETETTSIWLRSVVKSAASTSESDLLPQPQVRASFSDWSDRVSTQNLGIPILQVASRVFTSDPKSPGVARVQAASKASNES